MAQKLAETGLPGQGCCSGAGLPDLVEGQVAPGLGPDRAQQAGKALVQGPTGRNQCQNPWHHALCVLQSLTPSVALYAHTSHAIPRCFHALSGDMYLEKPFTLTGCLDDHDHKYTVAEFRK